MHSCIYKGSIQHQRRGKAANGFRYTLFMLLLDLDELDTVFDPYWLWSAHRPALARFRREDHYGDSSVPLATSIRDLVERESGHRPSGSIRLLTHLSYFGYCFNPISVYYCYDKNNTLSDVVLEVSNTPWGEQHCYVLSAECRRSTTRHHYRFSKAMHVSPFMPMDMEYACRLTPPGDNLYVGLDNYRDSEKVFGSHLALERNEITAPAMASTLLRDPFMTLKVVTLIHWQALKLWFKRAKLYNHQPLASVSTSLATEAEKAHKEGLVHNG